MLGANYITFLTGKFNQDPIEVMLRIRPPEVSSKLAMYTKSSRQYNSSPHAFVFITEKSTKVPSVFQMLKHPKQYKMADC
ncbi:hypothetical protein OUZ56_033259 [Daphnia magna]|uniref:Uncharacterized protein n=1 Tax=Daphnia magna TaxID=35525 RepID=A0ABQ9ZXK1_9CRUS|nr:hypothetical protein OUZ56_033259 [Daphnia magna]